MNIEQMNGINLRECFLAPIPEIEEAASLLDLAVNAHLAGNTKLVEAMLVQANMPVIRAWTESIWGKKSPHVIVHKIGSSVVPSASPAAAKVRTPTLAEQHELHNRHGYRCRFCGIPLVRAEVRKKFVKLYPQLNLWGRSNGVQHAAFQAMWAQYDHIVPHSRGGGNDANNLVITCAPCNFGRMQHTLAEVGLRDPRDRQPIRSEWEGLERFLS